MASTCFGCFSSAWTGRSNESDSQQVRFGSFSELGARNREVCFAPRERTYKSAGRSPAGSPVTTRVT